MENMDSKLLCMRQIIEDDTLNYRSIIYKRSTTRTQLLPENSEDDNAFYVEFKKKKLTYRGKKSHLITMTDVTASMKYTKVRDRIDLLNSL